jgi:predicted metal-dependent hydrolase
MKPSSNSDEEILAAGIDLFNSGRFFECHEEWEQVWMRSSGERKLFYQGLIQAAVAILHAQRGNLAGARTVYERASMKLAPLPRDYLGIALGALRDDLQIFFTELQADHPTASAPPKIVTYMR